MSKIELSILSTGKIGDPVEGELLVKTARKAVTKTNKAYLNITLSDGVQDTVSNVWNWTAENIPQPNDVVAIEGSIGEYHENRQLNISSLKRSKVSSEEFAPKGDFDIEAYWQRFNTLASNVTNPFYKAVLEHFTSEKYEALWKSAPSALGFHHNCVAGNLWHSVDTCNNAVALYANYSTIASLDLVITGSLLHDIGKLETYRLNGATIEMTVPGQLLDHIALGIMNLETLRGMAYEMGETASLELLMHCIASHHGKTEYGSPVTPRCLEAIIINYADGLDAKARNYIDLDKIAVNGTWTNKMYMLDNKPMLISNYVRGEIDE